MLRQCSLPLAGQACTDCTQSSRVAPHTITKQGRFPLAGLCGKHQLSGSELYSKQNWGLHTHAMMLSHGSPLAVGLSKTNDVMQHFFSTHASLQALSRISHVSFASQAVLAPMNENSSSLLKTYIKTTVICSLMIAAVSYIASLFIHMQAFMMYAVMTAVACLCCFILFLLYQPLMILLLPLLSAVDKTPPVAPSQLLLNSGKVYACVGVWAWATLGVAVTLGVFYISYAIARNVANGRRGDIATDGGEVVIEQELQRIKQELQDVDSNLAEARAKRKKRNRTKTRKARRRET